MKKITLLLSFLITTTLSFGQVVFSEDFEGGLSLPPAWTNNDIAGNGEVWTFDNTGDAIGFTPPNGYLYDLAMMDGIYASFDSDGYGNNGTAENAALESPIFDCSTLTDVTLGYNHFFTAGYAGEAHVEVYNGTTWIEVALYDGDTTDYGYVSLNVTAQLAGVPNAQVRFRFVGDYSWGWSVDNVSVFQCTVSNPSPPSSPVPSNAASNVVIEYANPTTSSRIGPFEWTPAPFGDAADSFNFNLGITSSGDDIGTISGFTNGNNITYGWQPNTTYYWRIDAVNCAGTTPGPVWSFTTQACTELSGPGAATGPSPANGATDVALDTGNNNSLAFSWTAADPDDNFTINIGTVNPPDNQIPNFDIGDDLVNLSANTTYYWSIDAVNCFGVTTSAVWSFTTGDILSVDDSELQSAIKVYPNPVSNLLHIKTSLDIDSIEVYNLLGQEVSRFAANQILDNSIDISNLNKGIYLVKISVGDRTETINIVKE